MIVDDQGKKLTPTQVAKKLIESAAYAPVEDTAQFAKGAYVVDDDKLTRGDLRRIEAAVRKQYDRVRHLMGFEKIYD